MPNIDIGKYFTYALIGNSRNNKESIIKKKMLYVCQKPMNLIVDFYENDSFLPL